MRHFGRIGPRANVLRIPGICAPDREGGTPRARLLKGAAVLAAAENLCTDHIHADDLARACVAALWHGQPHRICNVNDDTVLRMGGYFDMTADR